MKTLPFLHRLLLLLLAVAAFSTPVSAARGAAAHLSNIILPTAALPPGCQARLEELKSASDWYAQLVDPVLNSAEEIEARAAQYAVLVACLDQDAAALPDDLKNLRRLLEYFLVFAGDGSLPSGGSVLRLVDPAESEDPALRRIREQAGVPPPPGLFFVRLYPSREAMPALVRQAFAEDTLGVTILTRYIAVPVEEEAFWAEQVLQAQTLPTTISHELVHAYVNARLGADFLPVLPDWYSEGLAIYFSGSGARHAVQTPNFTLVVTSPEDYQQYDQNFRYLESRLGEAGLLQQIRHSIEARDPARLYGELGIPDAAALADQANAWSLRRSLLRLSALLAAILAALWGLVRYFNRFPDAWCIHCDYGGKWREFRGGLCPRCGLPFNKAVEAAPGPEETPSSSGDSRAG